MVRNNPLLNRLIGPRPRMWIEIPVGVAAGLGLAIVGSESIRRAGLSSDALNGLLGIMALIYVSAPPFTALTAALLASADSTSEQYQLLRLTTISNSAIAMGYVLAALYRLRWLLVILIGLLPIEATAITEWADSLPPEHTTPIGYIFMVPATTGIMSFEFPAAALGVAAGLYWGKNKLAATLSAPAGALVLLPFAVVFVLLSLVGLIVLFTNLRVSFGSPALNMAASYGILVSISIICFGLFGLLLVRLAARWARKT